MASRYNVRDEYDDDGGQEPRGTAVDIVPAGKDGKPIKPDQSFNDLERGTFRNDPPVNFVDEDRDEDRDDDRAEDRDDIDDRDDAREDREERRERDERREERGRHQDESVRKRLARERRLREESDTDAEFYRERTETLERRLNTLETKLTSGETSAALEADAEKIRDKISDVKIKLKAAKESGDVDAEVELSAELGRLSGDLQVNAYKVEDAKKQAKAAADAGTATVEPNRHLAKWKRRHGAWYANPVNANIAVAVEKEVLATGSNVRTEAHFREITRRLAKLYPKEFSAREYRGGEDDGERRPRPPVHGGNDDEGSPAKRRTTGDINIEVRGGKAYLTPDHYTVMKKFGMDPEDPNDVNTFVRENVKTRR